MWCYTSRCKSSESGEEGGWYISQTVGAVRRAAAAGARRRPHPAEPSRSPTPRTAFSCGRNPSQTRAPPQVPPLLPRRLTSTAILCLLLGLALTSPTTAHLRSLSTCPPRHRLAALCFLALQPTPRPWLTPAPRRPRPPTQQLRPRCRPLGLRVRQRSGRAGPTPVSQTSSDRGCQTPCAPSLPRCGAGTRRP